MSAPAPAESDWFVTTAGGVSKPLKRDELVRLAASGRLGPGRLVRRGRSGEWVAARDVPDLFRSRDEPSPAPDPPADAAAAPTGSACVVPLIGAAAILLTILGGGAAIVLTAPPEPLPAAGGETNGPARPATAMPAADAEVAAGGAAIVSAAEPESRDPSAPPATKPIPVEGPAPPFVWEPVAAVDLAAAGLPTYIPEAMLLAINTGGTPPLAAAFARDGGVLLLAAGDRVRAYALPSGDRLADGPAGLDRVEAAAVSPDGKTAALITQTSNVFWDLASGDVRTVPRAEADVRAGSPHLLFTPDGTGLIVAAGAPEDGSASRAALYDAATGRHRGRLPGRFPMAAAGDRLAMDGAEPGTVTLWDLSPGVVVSPGAVVADLTPAEGAGKRFDQVALSVDGRTVWARRHKTLTRLEVGEDGAVAAVDTFPLRAAGRYPDARLSPDGRTVSLLAADPSADEPNADAPQADGSALRLHALPSGHTARLADSGVGGYATFSGDGGTFGKPDGRGRFRVWRRVPADSAPADAIAYTAPDGSLFEYDRVVGRSGPNGEPLLLGPADPERDEFFTFYRGEGGRKRLHGVSRRRRTWSDAGASTGPLSGVKAAELDDGTLLHARAVADDGRMIQTVERRPDGTYLQTDYTYPLEGVQIRRGSVWEIPPTDSPASPRRLFAPSDMTNGATTGVALNGQEIFGSEAYRYAYANGLRAGIEKAANVTDRDGRVDPRRAPFSARSARNMVDDYREKFEERVAVLRQIDSTAELLRGLADGMETGCLLAGLPLP